jgi:hypothetical protein
MRGKIRLDRFAKLEETTTDLYGKVKDAAFALSVFDASVHTRGTEITNVEKELFYVKDELDSLLESIPSVTNLLILAPAVDVLTCANELVLADNACTLGRDGCEKRWDKAMQALKKALNRIDFNDEAPKPVYSKPVLLIAAK